MREGGNDAGEEEEEAAAARVWFSWLRVGGSCREENHWDGNGERVVLSASSRRLGGMGTGRRRRRLADDRNLPCQGCQRNRGSRLHLPAGSGHLARSFVLEQSIHGTVRSGSNDPPPILFGERHAPANHSFLGETDVSVCERNRSADTRLCNVSLTSVSMLVHESFQRDAVLSLKSGGRGGDAAIAEETLRTAPRTAEKTWLRRCWNTNWKTKVVFRDSNPPGN